MQKKDIRYFDGHPFSQGIPDIQESLLRAYKGGSLKFQETFTCLPKEGVVVRHNGTSGNRVGWVGVIVTTDSLEEEDPVHIGVRWLFDKHGQELKLKYPYASHIVGVYQSYTVIWCRTSMQVGRVGCFSLNEIFGKSIIEKPKKVKQNEELVKMVNNDHKGSFIVWGQKGSRNPVNVTGYTQALAAAEAMTVRHKETFHVAKLVSKVSPKIEVIPQVEEL